LGLIRRTASSAAKRKRFARGLTAKCLRSRKCWKNGTKQRAAYELMLNVGTARVDTHLTTWVQADAEDFEYTRRKTGVPVAVSKAKSLSDALFALPRKHFCILTTEYGKPFTVDGFSGWMRGAMTKAGLPLDCKPHGLRKTFGRLLADSSIGAGTPLRLIVGCTLLSALLLNRFK
jgi:enterobacteria phage integrase